MLYLACMRFLFPLLCILLTAGCAGRTIDNNNARDVILELPQSTLEKEDVEVIKVTQIGGTEAIAETQLKTAFRLEKVKGAMDCPRGAPRARPMGEGEQPCRRSRGCKG